MSDVRDSRAIADSLTWLRESASMLAIAVAATYGVGFLVVGAFLFYIGASSFELVRWRYLSAALPFLVVIIGAWSTSSIAVAFARRGRAPATDGKGVLDRTLTAAGFRGLEILIASVALLALSKAETWLLGLLAESNDVSEGAVFFVNLGIGLSYALVYPASLVRRVGLSYPSRVVFALVALMVLLMYALTIYPALPTVLGGGRPEHVRLVLENPMGDDCPACDGGDVLLVDQGDRLLVLTPEISHGNLIFFHATIIPTSQVRAVIGSTRPRLDILNSWLSFKAATADESLVQPGQSYTTNFFGFDRSYHSVQFLGYLDAAANEVAREARFDGYIYVGGYDHLGPGVHDVEFFDRAEPGFSIAMDFPADSALRPGRYVARWRVDGETYMVQLLLETP